MQSGFSDQSAPNAESWSGVDVGAKRGVMT